MMIVRQLTWCEGPKCCCLLCCLDTSKLSLVLPTVNSTYTVTHSERYRLCVLLAV